MMKKGLGGGNYYAVHVANLFGGVIKEECSRQL